MLPLCTLSRSVTPIVALGDDKIGTPSSTCNTLQSHDSRSSYRIMVCRAQERCHMCVLPNKLLYCTVWCHRKTSSIHTSTVLWNAKWRSERGHVLDEWCSLRNRYAEPHKSWRVYRATSLHLCYYVKIKYDYSTKSVWSENISSSVYGLGLQ